MTQYNICQTDTSKLIVMQNGTTLAQATHGITGPTILIECIKT